MRINSPKIGRNALKNKGQIQGTNYFTASLFITPLALDLQKFILIWTYYSPHKIRGQHHA